jgi:hypothetical protein
MRFFLGCAGCGCVVVVWCAAINETYERPTSRMLCQTGWPHTFPRRLQGVGL